VSATSTDRLRIGEVAELTGTTPRTIRYYEEIGLLAGAPDRVQGQHRFYTQADVEQINEIVRLRDLLGLSLEQLSQMLEAQAARAEIKREYQLTEDPDLRRRLLQRSLHHIANQLELVRGRRAELEKLESELVDKRRLVQKRLKELG
jgi:DNA-binding transcriptional MerR regulator